MEAKQAMEIVDGRISLMGNINNPELLLHGSADQVAVATRDIQESGVQIVGPECAIPLGTPLENLQAVARTITTGKNGDEM